METTERFEPLTAEEAERVRGGKTGDAGKTYRVTEEDYYKYKKGMTVEVHTTPYGRTLLGIYDAESKRLLTEKTA